METSEQTTTTTARKPSGARNCLGCGADLEQPRNKQKQFCQDSCRKRHNYHLQKPHAKWVHQDLGDHITQDAAFCTKLRAAIRTGLETDGGRFCHIPIVDLTPHPVAVRIIMIIGRPPDVAAPKFPPMKRIKLAVCEHFSVTEAELCSTQRNKRVTRPRQIAMYLCKKYAGQSMPKIAKVFGDRDHTTVLHAVRKITELMQTDPKIAADVEELSKVAA